MRYTIEQASDIGGVIRAARKVQNLRQDDAAGSVGVSESFMVKAERGADTIQWGKLFQILQGLGVRVVVDIPDANDELLERQSARASHRASVRARRAAEQLLLRTSDAARTAGDHAGAPPAPERVLNAARLLLAGAAAESASPPAASRALDIARRVLAEADAARPAKETPHD
ncbi:XRE family transcriptional regulator [Burkholderia stagnalis]|uniref:helix-turn-helix domain-containing protein n=1 Tax=Burkholderia stagnalis TaxID=1503054 RepID=UPI00075F8918|nr:helix-turn-helix domain-containing protein [Burkholderia stagnalis]KWK51255.1 XRE family transcriptional regulator [Burkholderia stagnalis]KWK52374.1 XRE family transcriptional regulator [Burkholderia stagnalis]KWN66583.1 XRE family transcriptional regulator [Burkholderia stagnalis]